jgi:hypothetical protein
MKDKEDELISAQVVLNAATTTDPQAVLDEFAGAGFAVGPLFANSFSITATGKKFEKFFGVGLRSSAKEGVRVSAKGKAAGSALPLDELPAGIKEQIETILFTKPPDFGLGMSF